MPLHALCSFHVHLLHCAVIDALALSIAPSLDLYPQLLLVLLPAKQLAQALQTHTAGGP